MSHKEIKPPRHAGRLQTHCALLPALEDLMRRSSRRAGSEPDTAWGLGLCAPTEPRFPQRRRLAAHGRKEKCSPSPCPRDRGAVKAHAVQSHLSPSLRDAHTQHTQRTGLLTFSKASQGTTVLAHQQQSYPMPLSEPPPWTLRSSLVLLSI